MIILNSSLGKCDNQTKLEHDDDGFFQMLFF